MRLPRLCPAEVPVHVVHRGHDRKACFGDTEDYHTYLAILGDAAQAYGVSVHAWVLMTNHIHLLVTPSSDQAVSRMMQYLGRNYVRHFNQRYVRTGTLWEGRFKSCVVDSDEYFIACQRYIELNPVRAGIVLKIQDYQWSSYQRNGLGHLDSLVTPSDFYLGLGSDEHARRIAYRKIFKAQLSDSTIEDLRVSTAKGLAFGSNRFKEQIEAFHHRRVKPVAPGPKKK